MPTEYNTHRFRIWLICIDSLSGSRLLDNQVTVNERKSAEPYKKQAKTSNNIRWLPDDQNALERLWPILVSMCFHLDEEFLTGVLRPYKFHNQFSETRNGAAVGHPVLASYGVRRFYKLMFLSESEPSNFSRR